jgi:hypothetical protein
MNNEYSFRLEENDCECINYCELMSLYIEDNKKEKSNKKLLKHYNEICKNKGDECSLKEAIKRDDGLENKLK